MNKKDVIRAINSQGASQSENGRRVTVAIVLVGGAIMSCLFVYAMWGLPGGG